MDSMKPAGLTNNDGHEHEEGLEVHPAVALLVARMESHPEEFYQYDKKRPTMRATGHITSPRSIIFTSVLNDTRALWNRKEKRLYNAALRKVRLAEAHARLMATLLSEPQA